MNEVTAGGGDEAVHEKTPERPYSPEVVQATHHVLRWLRRSGASTVLGHLVSATYLPIITVVCTMLNRVHLVGRDRVPDGTGYLFLSNHTSMLDGPLIGFFFLPRVHWYPSKADFYKSAGSAVLYTLFGVFRTFPVRRGERDMDAVNFMRDLLKSGQNILLFPEGTRSRDGRLLVGKPGVGGLVEDTESPVVPVFHWGLEPLFRGLPFYFGKDIVISFGRPVRLHEGIDEDDPQKRRRRIAQRAMDEIYALAVEAHDKGLIPELPERNCVKERTGDEPS